MTVATGIVASLVAPLLEAVGFLEWDIHWKKAGGSAFALNLFKCNLAAAGFFFISVLVDNRAHHSYHHQQQKTFDVYVDNVGHHGEYYKNNFNNINYGHHRNLREKLFDRASRFLQWEDQGRENSQQQEAQNFRHYPHPQMFQQGHFSQPEIHNSQFHMFHQQHQMQEVQDSLLHKNQYPQEQHESNFYHQQQNMQTPNGYAQPYRNQDMGKIHIDDHFVREDRMDAFNIVAIGHLVLSSLLGIIIGDLAELEALRLVGARRVLLIDTIKPFMASFLGMFFLGERLTIFAFLGMVLTAFGVYIVLMVSLEQFQITTIKKKKENKLTNDGETVWGRVHSSNNITNSETGVQTGLMGLATVRASLSRHDLLSDYEELILDTNDVDYSDEDEESDDGGMRLMESFSSDDEEEGGNSSISSNSSWGYHNKDDDNSDSSEEPFFIQENPSPPTSPKVDTGTKRRKNEGNSSMPQDQKHEVENGTGNNTTTTEDSSPSKNDPLQLSTRSSRLRRYGLASSSAGSMSSFLSVESECGPPPGYYGSGRTSKRERRSERQRRLRLGYGLALLNVTLDAYGSLLTKEYGENLNTWEINTIRYGFAGIVLLFISIAMRIRDKVFFPGLNKKNMISKAIILGIENGSNGGLASPANNQSSSPVINPWYQLPNMEVEPWLIVSLGVLFVTFLCPALTNYALFEIALGLAVTLHSTTPLYTVPLSYLLKGEVPTKRGVLGALMASGGVIILCVWGMESDGIP